MAYTHYSIYAVARKKNGLPFLCWLTLYWKRSR